MSPDVLAARILAAIDRNDAPTGSQSVADYCREQVASDLAGLQQHQRIHGWRPHPKPRQYAACQCCGCDCPGREDDGPEWPCPDAARYTDGLLRTAALYSVTP
ncbi:MAG: hypothetical protein H7233_01610 [Pseudorhodobacter sp.]|nr:hypothetical protein [Frankiaceae bacterium]